jgi:PAS domain S-box-containing protein
MTAVRIIVVEDERLVALHLKQQLTKLGYEVVAVAASGQQALDRIVDLRPDLVLMDIHIEGKLDGIEVCTRIPDALGIPVIYVTAYSEEGTLRRARATQPYGFLVKPFSERELHATIQMALERHQVYHQLQSSRLDVEEANRQLRLKIEANERTERELRRVNEQLRTTLADKAIAERALMRREAEFRAGFEGSAIGKALVEPETKRILRANRAFARMLGREPEEIVNRTGFDFTWPEDRASGLAEYERLLAGDIETYVDQKRYMRRDGTPFWVRVSAVMARVPQSDHPTLAVAEIEDIDDRHNAETALLAAKRDLEALVIERTNALKQRDLLLREVYHRVKNNLQIVDGLLVMQARKTHDPQARNGLDGLRGRIYALGLVHHQLMGSADLQTFDVGPFLHELSKNLLDGGGASGVGLSVDACALSVGLDFAVPFGLLTTELVANSLKHGCSDGRGNISVVLRNDPQGQLILVVSDDGGGRPRDAGVEVADGVGSGIIKSLIAQLQGTMIVQTDNGMRTEIHMAAPAPT